MRGWNYSSNYLDGSSTNPWYIEDDQLDYDLADIAAAGMNTIKVYVDENNAAAHLAALDKVESHGLKAILLMFVPYNTDYSVATGGTNRTAEVAAYAGMVTNLASHPAVIGVGFGNENNINRGSTSLTDWFTLIEAAIQAGKAVNDTVFHFTANSEVADIRDYGYLVPSIDVWGVNIYRGTTFTDLWVDTLAASPKPFILTEFGRKRPDNLSGSQATQATEVVDLIEEAESIYPYITSWVHFKFTHTRDTDTGDEFWEAALPLAQGVYQSRTKMQLYTDIKNYLTL